MINIYEQNRLLAKNLINNSCKLQPHEKVLITYSDTPNEFIETLIEEITLAQGIAIPFRLDQVIKRRLLLNSNRESLQCLRDFVAPIMSSVNAVILISGSHNDFEYSDIPKDIMSIYNQLYVEPIHFEIRCQKNGYYLDTLLHPLLKTAILAPRNSMSISSEYAHWIIQSYIHYSSL